MQSSIQHLVTRLRTQLLSCEVGDHITAHDGRELAASKADKARFLREANASWDWVALSVDTVDFWDAHIGMIPHPSIPDHYTVGLHWTERSDPAIRPVAATIIGSQDPTFSELAEEFQLTLPASGPAGSLPGPEAATAAIALAVQFLSFQRSLHTQQ